MLLQLVEDLASIVALAAFSGMIVVWGFAASLS